MGVVGVKLQIKGLTASQVIRLIGLLLVFASQKTVHNVRNEMAESVVPVRKKMKDSLTRQGMWNIRGLRRKGLAEREEKERVLSSDRAHKQVLAVKKNMHLIMNSSTGTLVTVAISTAPDGGFHRESMSLKLSYKFKFDLQPGSLTDQVAGEHQPYQKHP